MSSEPQAAPVAAPVAPVAPAEKISSRGDPERNAGVASLGAAAAAASGALAPPRKSRKAVHGWQDLQELLRNEWLTFSQTVEDKLDDHLHRQELMLNQQSLRIEGMISSRMESVQQISPLAHSLQVLQQGRELAQRASEFGNRVSELSHRVSEYGNRNSEFGNRDSHHSHRDGHVMQAISDHSVHYDSQDDSYVGSDSGGRRHSQLSKGGVDRMHLRVSPRSTVQESLFSGMSWREENLKLGSESPRASQCLAQQSTLMQVAQMVTLPEERQTSFGKSVLDPASGFVERWATWWVELEEPVREGRLAYIVGHKAFELCCAAVIGLNSVVTVYTTNFEASHLKEELSLDMFLVNFAFVLFYCTEIGLKLRVHRFYYFCNDEMMWNVFDFMLILVAIYDVIYSGTIETEGLNLSHMRTMRLLRLAKILRMVRVMRFFSELRLILNSVMGSMVSLFWSIVMLLLIFFIFSLIFVQGATSALMNESNNISPDDRQELQEVLGSMQHGIFMLYQATTGGDDWIGFYRLVELTGPVNSILFLFFIAFAQLALLNILTGIYVENAMKLAQPDRDQLAMAKRQEELQEEQELRRLCQAMDAKKTGFISSDQFHRFVKSDHFKAKLQVLGLDIKDTEIFFHIIASDFNQVPIEAFVSGAMRLKGSASSLDLQTMMFGTRLIYSNQIQFHDSVDQRLDRVLGLLGDTLDRKSPNHLGSIQETERQASERPAGSKESAPAELPGQAPAAGSASAAPA